MTLEEVAIYVHTTPEKLKGAIIAGQLRAFTIGQDEWRVTEPALLEFMGEVDSQQAGRRVRHGATTNISLRANDPTDTHLEDIHWQPSGPFTYQWPKILEQMDSSYTAELTIHGETKAFTIGFTNRKSAGMERRRAIVFLGMGPQSLKPLVEFVGSNEFATNGQMASPIKVAGDADGSWRIVRSDEPLPPEYEGLTIAEYRDIVRGPNAARAAAVVVHKDDLTVLLRHGIIRATWKGWL